MGRLIPLLALADLAIMVVALIDCLSVDENAIRALPRIVWVLLILLFSPAGGIAWFVAGRPPRVATGGQQWQPGDAFPGSDDPTRDLTRELAPDDDPEFLRRIGGGGGAAAAREDTELLRAWEADLRRREEELRKKEGRPGDDDPAG
ncbi:MAG TPA: PLD nuclease N-terminal domain-containing protein [Rugosimonospora sp.]|nr:PLD nuclease N-terminal domain-containing protein [Rugosimonospora sp.]